MTRSRLKVLFIVLAAILTFVMLVTSVYAIEPRTTGAESGITATSENDVMPIAEDGHDHAAENNIDIYEGDLYILYGEDYSTTNYVMDKYVDGNVFIFGQNVTITGQINGSLFVFAQNLTIEEGAGVGIHTFAFADTITMKGITSDMYAFAKKFNFTNTAMVYRDLKLAAEESYLTGYVARDIHLAGEKIEVYQGEEKALTVGGDFNYTSKTRVENEDKIKVGGEVKFTPDNSIEASSENKVASFIYKMLENSVFALVIYACFMFLAPKFIGKSKDYVSTRGLLTLPIGLGFTVLIPIIVLILMITGIGVSLSFALLMVYFLVIMLNSTIVTIALNEFISNKFNLADSAWKRILMIIPVSLVIFLIRQIPVLGGWITALIVFAGTGIATLYQFDKRRKETKTEENTVVS